MNHQAAALSYPVPTNEEDRLQMLGASCMLDSAPDPVFDTITREAQQHFNVPIAVISLVDRHRQWFKSKQGLDATQTPRDQAFCAHTIITTDVMVVPDATQDTRFVNNPLVTDAPHIRFYAGAPIIVPDGLILGTLCLIDTVARHDFSDAEAITLSSMADKVRQLIEDKIEG